MDRPTFAAQYRAARTRSGGACPLEVGTLGRLADHECRHERLPFDRTPTCGYWPQEGAELALFPTPRRARASGPRVLSRDCWRAAHRRSVTAALTDDRGGA